jgi:hypothetical protein
MTIAAAEWIPENTNPFIGQHNHRPTKPAAQRLESATTRALAKETKTTRDQWAALVGESAAANGVLPPRDVLRALADRLGIESPEASFQADLMAYQRHGQHLTTAAAARQRLAEWRSIYGDENTLRAEARELENRLAEIRVATRQLEGVTMLVAYDAKAAELKRQRPMAFPSE